MPHAAEFPVCFQHVFLLVQFVNFGREEDFPRRILSAHEIADHVVTTLLRRFNERDLGFQFSHRLRKRLQKEVLHRRLER